MSAFEPSACASSNRWRIAAWGVAALGLWAGARGSSVGVAQASARVAIGRPVLEDRTATASSAALPTTIRVGLASDLESVALCCAEDESLRVGARVLARAARVVIHPRAPAAGVGVYRRQVAALKDRGAAEAMAQRLAGAMGWPADAVFDATDGLYRVRVGAFATREEVEQATTALANIGVSESWVVHEARDIADAGFRVVTAAGEQTVVARRLIIESRSGIVGYAGTRYRGRLELFLNNRGKINLINELPFEDYLRGVVPREMGPEEYPEIEALKAQAVAARTYSVRSLRGFVEEGYDICAGPRCQVYGGQSAEHPVTDRALQLTRGELLVYHGQPIEALYTASCGGHTENVEVPFPSKRAPYLRGVRCVEQGGVVIASGDRPWRPLESALVERWLGPGSPGVRLDPRLRQLLARAGLTPPRDHLASERRRDVERFVRSMFDLVLDPRLFAADEPPAAEWTRAERRLRSSWARPELFGGDPAAALTFAQQDVLLVELGRYLQQLIEVEARVLGVDGETLRLDGSGEIALAGQSPPAPYRRTAAGDVPADLELSAGDRLLVHRSGEQTLAIVQLEELGIVQLGEPSAPATRVPALQPWVRNRSERQLERAVASRYPGLRLRSFETLEPGASGRIRGLRFAGSDGEIQEVLGLELRWLLDLPDLPFAVERVDDSGWRFWGRGRGHGVGLCQLGAVQMAQGGYGYREILDHYYSQVEIERLPSSARAASTPR